MANVYVEPEPKGRPHGSAITHYVLEYGHGARVTNTNYGTQEDAVSAAKGLGHSPLVARVRNTSKGIRTTGVQHDARTSFSANVFGTTMVTLTCGNPVNSTIMGGLIWHGLFEWLQPSRCQNKL